MAILSTIGAVLGAAGNIASGIMSAVNNKKARQQQEAENARRIAAAEAKANEDPLSTAKSRQLLAQYDRDAKKQLENAQGVAAITGATPEYTLAIQDSIAQGRADVMSGIAVAGEERAERAEERAEEARQQAAENQLAMTRERNQTYANLAANAANAAGSMIGAVAPKKAKYSKAATAAGNPNYASIYNSGGEPTYEGTLVGGENNSAGGYDWRNLSDEELYK